MNIRLIGWACAAGVVAAICGARLPSPAGRGAGGEGGSASAATPVSAAFSAQTAAPAAQSAKKPNILLITIDTLRPDRLGCYGYSRPTSPHLDALAAQSVRFDRAFSTSSFTPPSHASIMTSLYVGQHGLRTWNKLPEEHETIAETLLAAGWRTGASVNLNLLKKNNLGQGFQWQREELRDGRVVVNNALELIRHTSAASSAKTADPDSPPPAHNPELDSQDPSKPFFLWLHVYDVHRPYGREGSWARKFNPTGRAGVGDPETHYNLFPAKVKQRGLSDEDLKFIDDRYDAGIAYIDAQLGPLFAELNSAEHLANTMIIVTADHGENLLDRRERVFTHDPYLFQEVGRVPLIVRYPGLRGAGTHHDQVVSLIDVAPTILDAAGVAAPKAYQGLSLLTLTNGGAWTRDSIFQETWGVSEAKAIRSSERLVLNDKKAGKTLYFDLKSDPKEMNPLDAPPDDAAKAFAERLTTFAGTQRSDVAQDVDPELEKKLKSLGYTGGDDDEEHDPQTVKPRKNRNKKPEHKEP